MKCDADGCDNCMRWWSIGPGPKWVGRCNDHLPKRIDVRTTDANGWVFTSGTAVASGMAEAYEDTRCLLQARLMCVAVDAARAFLDTLRDHGGDAAAADVVRAEVVLRDALAALGGES